ncbi:MAG: hypothetical protein ACK4QW_05745 [Alphaproteobacteria bacterium]
MRISTACLALLFASATWAQAAADIVGDYDVYGRTSEGNYAGEASVVKRGSTYHVMWLIGNQLARGTGILTGTTFSVTFLTQGMPVPGVAVYEIGPEGVLTGQFTLLGGTSMGAEAWTPAKKP